MWKKGILREFKDTLQPVQHGTWKSKRVKDKKGKSTGVSVDDPGRTRNKAWKAIKGQMDDAKKREGCSIPFRR